VPCPNVANVRRATSSASHTPTSVVHLPTRSLPIKGSEGGYPHGSHQLLTGSEMRTPQDRVDQLFSILITQGDADYIGERISQLEHSLQAAHLATKAGADDETVLAALLHDVGQFLPGDGAEAMRTENGSVGRWGHEQIGATFLAQIGFSKKVCDLVGAHVVAKRYLTATDKAYYDQLSDASKASLRFQGGPFTADEVRVFELDPLFQAKVALRKWDDGAKVVGLDVPPLIDYQPMALSHLDSQIPSL